jgi:steroid delta-isomerase-like uncharacterized protein
MPDDPQSAAAIREALMRANRAENDLANIGVEGVIRAVDEFLAPNWEGGGNGQPDHSRADERESERALFTAVPDYHRTFDNIVIEPPFAAVRWTFTGTHSHTYLGLPATGRTVSNTGMSLFEFEAGRVRRSWIYFDTAALMQQLTAPSGS